MNPTDNTHARAQLDKVDDSGKQQKVQTSGLKNQKLGGEKHGVVRLQSFGFNSVPPKGSQGVVLMLNGNPDQSYVANMEHPDHRPKDSPDGSSRMYDAHGNYFEVKDGQGTMVIAGNLTITVSGTVIIDSPDINLGGAGGVPILLEGGVTMGHPATKVKGI